MSWLHKETVLDSLLELSCKEKQLQLWLSTGHSKVSSFTEAYEQLFSDSGLDEILKSGKIAFSQTIDKKLIQLDKLMSKVDTDQTPNKLIETPKIEQVRKKALEVLALMEINLRKP